MKDKEVKEKGTFFYRIIVKYSTNMKKTVKLLLSPYKKYLQILTGLEDIFCPLPFFPLYNYGQTFLLVFQSMKRVTRRK